VNELMVIEHGGQRVLTTAQLAESFGSDVRRISENFIRNVARYTAPKHFYLLEGDELKDFKREYANCGIAPNVNSLYLWSEKGAWMHAKSLNTDQAWSAYEALVDGYYIVKATDGIDIAKLDPQMQMFHLMFESVAKTQLQLAEATQKLEQVTEAVEVMQDTFLQRDEDWRRQVNGLITSAAYRSQVDYQDMRTRSYRLLEERAHCDLDARLRNLKKRMEDAGAAKTQVSKTNRMDVIDNDPRLKEIYRTIAKEVNMGSMRVLSVR